MPSDGWEPPIDVESTVLEAPDTFYQRDDTVDAIHAPHETFAKGIETKASSPTRKEEGGEQGGQQSISASTKSEPIFRLGVDQAPRLCRDCESHDVQVGGQVGCGWTVAHNTRTRGHAQVPSQARGVQVPSLLREL